MAMAVAGVMAVSGRAHWTADDYFRAVPPAAYEFLAFAGVESRKPFADRLIKGATATVIMASLTYGAKYCISERRPDGSDRRSFPSGHTAMAFMGAELLRQDYGTWAGIGGYAVATGVGVMRVTGRHHWVHDVLAGAGIGFLSARAAEWVLPVERRLFGMDRQAVIVPAYSPADGSVMLTATLVF